MRKSIRQQILFVLEDDNEVMTAALDSDLDEENKQMNRELIQEHARIIGKIENGEVLSEDDLVLIRDANEIHLNDTANLAGHHRQALALDKWLKERSKADTRPSQAAASQVREAALGFSGD